MYSLERPCRLLMTKCCPAISLITYESAVADTYSNPLCSSTAKEKFDLLLTCGFHVFSMCKFQFELPVNVHSRTAALSATMMAVLVSPGMSRSTDGTYCRISIALPIFELSSFQLFSARNTPWRILKLKLVSNLLICICQLLHQRSTSNVIERPLVDNPSVTLTSGRPPSTSFSSFSSCCRLLPA